MINTLAEGYFLKIYGSPEERATVPERVPGRLLDKGPLGLEQRMSKLLAGGEENGEDRHFHLHEWQAGSTEEKDTCARVAAGVWKLQAGPEHKMEEGGGKSAHSPPALFPWPALWVSCVVVPLLVPTDSSHPL